jgi:mannosyltransferase
MCRTPLKNGKWRVFLARRVDEMIQGVLLKYLFGAKIKLVFSCATQTFCINGMVNQKNGRCDCYK